MFQLSHHQISPLLCNPTNAHCFEERLSRGRSTGRDWRVIFFPRLLGELFRYSGDAGCGSGRNACPRLITAGPGSRCRGRRGTHCASAPGQVRAGGRTGGQPRPSLPRPARPGSGRPDARGRGAAAARPADFRRRPTIPSGPVPSRPVPARRVYTPAPVPLCPAALPPPPALLSACPRHQVQGRHLPVAPLVSVTASADASLTDHLTQTEGEI